MQIVGLHKNIYRLNQCLCPEKNVPPAYQRYASVVEKWERCKARGGDESLCAEFCGVSRATYYRYKRILAGKAIPGSKRPKNVNTPQWSHEQLQLVRTIRCENPTYGKAKIAVILKRDHQQSLSESTIGRMLAALKKKGLIQKSPSALRAKRKRNFTKGHAKAWTYKDYRDVEMGERVQIDHMTVSKNGITFKHFQAWDRRSKYMSAQVYSHAKSTSAKRFLEHFLSTVPFAVRSIQVDGGSEFMADFEEACAKLGIELIVLPPARPTYNGGVERGNRIFREELYARNDLLADSVRAIQFELTKALHKYNTYRPHKNLKGLTPMQYIQLSTLEVAA